MTNELIKPNPEQKVSVADNARKFTLESLDPQFLFQHRVSSFILTIDWLETRDDNEQKLAHKLYDNGNIQILIISKVTENGSRTAEKEKITDEKYQELLTLSIVRLEKKRYEFEYMQRGTAFLVKYDEFLGSDLRILEADLSNNDETTQFDFSDFPVQLTEVSGDMRYTGYRVVEML